MVPSDGMYLIAREHDCLLDWPVFDTTAGRAVAAFTTQVRAEEYYRCRRFGPDWTVGRMDRAGFLRWLRENLGRGVFQLLIDPASGRQPCRAVPITTFLAAAKA